MTDEKKDLLKKLALIILLALLAIVAFFILTSDDSEEPNEEDEIIGAGGSNEPTSFPIVPPTGSENVDAEVIESFSPEEGLENNFEIDYSSNSSNNIFRIRNTSIEIPGVVFAKWSADNSFIMFNKTEKENCRSNSCVDDVSNIWTIDPDGTDLRRIYDYQGAPGISYVSNGDKIAFATASMIGTMNKDGSGLNIIKELEFTEVPSGTPYSPSIEHVNDETFEVEYFNEELVTVSERFEY